MQKKLLFGAVGIVILVAAGLFFVLRHSSSLAPARPSAGRLRVVATFFPLYDFTRAVGGDRIDPTLLFTQTPEAVSFAPGDVQKINTADVVIKNGLGLEPVLDELLAASDNKNVRVADTSAGVSVFESTEEDHPGADPHIWLNPRNAIIQVAAIRDALSSADPANAEIYRANAAAYITQLEALDREIESAATGFPRKDFVAFHSAFKYFANRYGLRQAAVIEEFPGKEPSPRVIADVITTIRATGVRAIFAEPQFSPRIVEVIAHDLGLTVRVLDPIESGDPQKDNYISLMRRNLDTLKEAMR